MERIDDVLGYSNLKIFQNDDYFSFSLDSVVLANYCGIRLRDKRIADLCSGNAVVSLILSQRTLSDIDAVEIQENLYDLAVKSVNYNKLEERIFVFNDDIKNFSLKHLNCYDLVVCNPPYFKVNNGSKMNLSKEKMIARHEIMINLREVCLCAKRILKDNGNLAIVHRSERLMDILYEMRENNIEPKRIRFVYEKINKPSTLVLVEGQKLGNVGLVVEEPLIMYEEDGSYTLEYAKLQREVRK